MSGYVAIARIEGVRPRRAGAEARARHDPERALPDRARGDEVALADLTETAVRDSLIERAEALRDRWSQLTFFLLDADSWR
jgi:hypothetical protein